ncbi:MAG: cyclic nucleotide-binding domain-containing protein [Candidatus Sericytochromatia bacterium]
MVKNFDFKYIASDEVEKISDLASHHLFNPGQVIFYAGHYPYGVFILIDGEVEVEISKKKTTKIHPTAVLGVESLSNLKSYPVTVKALTKCKLDFLSKSSYEKLVMDKKIGKF